MAATLPYPNMDFTPLDVLTAAEMDQMVANDKYLADFCTGLANGTNLENGMIPLRKLKSACITVISGDSYQQPIGAGAKIPLSKIENKVGDSLSLSDSSIVIGEDISYVKVSASVYYQQNGVNYGWFELMKKEKPVPHTRTITTMMSGFGTATLATVLVPVSSGDFFWLQNLDPRNINEINTFMTIEVIK